MDKNFLKKLKKYQKANFNKFGVTMFKRKRQLYKDQTLEEKTLYRELRREYKNIHGHKLTMKRQKIVGYYILDFFIPEYQVCIELDGSQHSSNKEYDQDRDMFLHSLGIQTLRYSNDDVNNNLKNTIENILNHLDERPEYTEIQLRGRSQRIYHLNCVIYKDIHVHKNKHVDFLKEIFLTHRMKRQTEGLHRSL